MTVFAIVGLVFSCLVAGGTCLLWRWYEQACDKEAKRG